MTSDGWMPKTSASPSYVGDYAENTYPNPLKTKSDAGGAWVVNAKVFKEEADPKARIPGDLGDLVYYQTKAGNYKDTGILRVAYAAVWDNY